MVASGCGGDDEPADRTEPFERTPLHEPAQSGREMRSSCELVRPGEVARAVRLRGTALEPSPNDSTDLSICDWRGGGGRVQLVVDSAPRAQLRYYNQHAEQLEFHNTEPDRRPYDVKHIGDDSAYGGAGAWWTPSKGQLVAYADERILRVRAPDRRGAARLARLAFERLNGPGP